MHNREHEAVKKIFAELQGATLKFFPKLRGKLDAPDDQGVYVIYGPNDKVLHVGRTYRGKKGLAQRLKDHLSGRSSFTREQFDKKGSKLRDGYKYRCLPIRKARKRALLEAYAIGCLCPTHFGTHEGAEK